MASTIFTKSGTITADTEWPLDAIALIETRLLTMRISVADPGALVGDTLDIYLCSRDGSGVWTDRIHATQVLGNGGAKEFQYTLQSDIPLDAAEQQGPIPGPAEGARLAANTCRDGFFNGYYLGNSSPENGWKIILDKGGAGSPSFVVTIRIDTQEKDVGY